MRSAGIIGAFRQEGRPLGWLAALAFVLHLALGAPLAPADGAGPVICTLAGAQSGLPHDPAATHSDLCAALCKLGGTSTNAALGTVTWVAVETSRPPAPCLYAQAAPRSVARRHGHSRDPPGGA